MKKTAQTSSGTKCNSKKTSPRADSKTPHACDMPNILQGQTVRVILHSNNLVSTWTLGICTDQLSDRSYEVLANGKKYSRNWLTEQLRIPPLIDHQTNMDEDD